MPVTHINVTDIAHDDHRMEGLLLEETGRQWRLDQDWTTLAAGAQGFHSFLYDSVLEFILIRTDREVRFQRIATPNEDVGLADVEWDPRTDEQYYIFKVDPEQKVIVIGSPYVRFFRCGVNQAIASLLPNVSRRKECDWNVESRGRSWDAEDVYKERDVVADESYPPEHLAEVARRFKAWRARSTQSWFVFLLVPERMGETEESLLRERGVRIVADVPWRL